MKENIKKIISKYKLYCFVFINVLLIPSETFCLELDGSVKNHDGKTLTNNSILQIVNIFSYVGAFALSVGVIQVILSIKDENADGKTKGMITAIVGIALISLNVILKAIGFGY